MIETELILRNISHFGQADNTPFASDPLQSAYGYEGTNILAKDLIFNEQLPDFIEELPI
jgi:hypothetical protein